MRPDRRQFLASCGASAITFSLPGFFSASPMEAESSPDASNVLPARSIAREGEKVFAERLTSQFPSLPGDLVTPFSLILTNLNDTAVHAYGVTWRYLSKERTVRSFTRVFTATASTTRHRIAYTGGRPLLQPGDSALVTPSYFLTARVYSRLHELTLSKNESALNSKALEFINERGPGSKVFSALTAKIYSHVASGVAPANIAASYMIRRAAERDEAAAIVDVLKFDPTLSIDAALIASRGTVAPNMSDAYYKHRRIFATCVGARSKTIGRQGLLAILERGAALNCKPLTIKTPPQFLPWGAGPQAVLNRIKNG